MAFKLFNKRRGLGLSLGLSLVEHHLLLILLCLVIGAQEPFCWQVCLLKCNFEQLLGLEIGFKGGDSEIADQRRNLLRAHLFGYERLAARGDHFKVALDVLARVPLHIPAEHGPNEGSHNEVVKIFDVILEQDVGRAHEH